MIYYASLFIFYGFSGIDIDLNCFFNTEAASDTYSSDIYAIIWRVLFTVWASLCVDVEG